MSLRVLFGWVFLGVSALVLVGCSGKPTTPLAFAPDVGDKRILVVDNDIAMSFSVMGQSASAGVRGGRRMLVEVTDVAPDGLVSLDMTFTEVHLDADMGAMDAYDFVDAASLDQSEYIDIVKGAVGETVELKITPDGEIRYIMGIQDLPERLLHKAEFPYGPRRNSLVMLLKQEFSQDTFEEGIVELFAAYRNAPSKQGDTWQNAYHIEAELPLAVQQDLTLSSLQGGVTVVDTALHLNANESGQSEILPGLSAQLSLTGTGTAQYRIDTESTWLREYSGRLKIPGSATISISGLGSISMTINVSGTSTARLLPADEA